MYKLILAVFTALSSVSIVSSATDYFIDPSNGSDTARGTSETEAWKTIDPLNNVEWKPGDHLLLQAGDTLRQAIRLDNIRGDSENPWIISRYGEGTNPVIDGNGADAALYFFNPAYVIVEQLTITNPDGRYGIFMEAQDAGELTAVTIREVEVVDVYQESFAISEPPKTIGGIVFKVEQGEQPTWWDGITIENCYIHDLGSCGISIGSDYKVNKVEPGETTYPILGVRIANNRIHDIVRDGAIIRQCRGGVMEYNEVSRTGLVAISNGLWWYDSDSCYLQYNEGYHCKAAFDKDGAPFSIDNSSTRCVIQYNYSHDNEGAGYMLFGHDDRGYGNTIRHNLSVNDHTNNASEGIGAIAIVSRVKDALVANNIIVAGPSTESVLGHRDWDGLPLEVTYEGNLFVGNGLAHFGHQVLPGGAFKNNFFINIPNLPEELKEQQSLYQFFEQQAKAAQLKRQAGYHELQQQ